MSKVSMKVIAPFRGALVGEVVRVSLKESRNPVLAPLRAAVVKAPTRRAPARKAAAKKVVVK